ncbi:MAG: histidine phosphatase family protein [Aeromicrobium sp.]|nr:histidine phosphatase family protein [Burkholderiales bacterium]
MDLILWRHADAVSAEHGDDFSRKLSGKGRKQASQMAHWLESRLPDSTRVFCGNWRRDVETAEALTGLAGRKLHLKPQFGAGADIAHLLAVVDWPENRQPAVIVAHQPVIGRLVSLLLFGQEGDIAVRKGSIWWLTNRRRGDGAEGRDVHPVELRAVVCPDLL